MGVISFYAWITRTYGSVIKYYKASEKVQTNIDCLSLDMNHIIHSAAQKVYGYGKCDVGVPDPTYNKVYEHVAEEMDMLIEMVQPKQMLVIAIDGVAGMGKMYQQMKRRYKAVANDKFNSASITPGTDFMNQLNEYMKLHIRQCQRTKWRHLNVLYSSPNVPGEGEHECMSVIRERRRMTHCIYGADADLIMLMMVNAVNGYVLRESHYDQGMYEFVDVSFLRRRIGMRPLDFIFTCFFVGNDFLPSIPNLAILDGGIESILKISKSLTIVEKNRTFNRRGLRDFLVQLADQEETMLQTRINATHYFEDNLVQASGGNLVKYKELYHEEYFPNENDLNNAVHEYLRGLWWVLLYYTRGMPDWTWYYPYTHAPFISDCIPALATVQFEFKKYTKPLHPLEQLALVLPPQSFHLLPKKLQSLPKKIPEEYPTEYTVDYRGKRYEYEGVVILPPRNVQRILEAVYAAKPSMKRPEHIKYYPKRR